MQGAFKDTPCLGDFLLFSCFFKFNQKGNKGDYKV
jgi:hypothetical protein